MIELLVLTLSGKMVMFSKNTNSNLSDSFVNYLETVDLGRFCKCFLVDKIENCHSVLPMYLQERTVSLSRVRSPDSVYALYKQVTIAIFATTGFSALFIVRASYISNLNGIFAFSIFTKNLTFEFFTKKFFLPPGTIRASSLGRICCDTFVFFAHSLATAVIVTGAFLVIISHCALLKRDHGNLPYAAANCSSKLCREAVNTIRQSIVRLYDRDEDLLHCCANER
ncbi:hypothetical protein T08_3200 [Trichinella sp. T8]|nr:hypothetical protein T08_3200 [Trichinella sp. T8]